MALCDELEAAEKELDTLEANLVDYLPKAILQAAVQGRLVPQNPSDEPATGLLKRIRKEKVRLVKEGKIKKQKPLPPILEDEVPFDLPDGWTWCRLGEIILKNIGGGTPSKQVSSYWGGDIPWASVKDLNCDLLLATIDNITPEGLANSTSNLIPAGNVIVCTRMGLGKVAVNTAEVAINQDLRALFLSEGVDQEFFIHYYKAQNITGSGMTVKGITIEELSTMLFPLPPLAEQQRIVAKADELLALCSYLKSNKELPFAMPPKLRVLPSRRTKQAPIAQDDFDGLRMAARGDASRGYSAKAMKAIDDLIGDDDDD